MTGWIYRSSWRWCGPAWPGPLHRLIYPYISTYIYNRELERGRLASTLLSLPPSLHVLSRPSPATTPGHAGHAGRAAQRGEAIFCPAVSVSIKTQLSRLCLWRLFFLFLFFLLYCVGVSALSRLCAHSRHDGRFSLPYCQSSKSTISALRRFSMTIPQSIAPDLLLVMIRSRETDTHFRGCIAQ
jgi:hypothetical protein